MYTVTSDRWRRSQGGEKGAPAVDFDLPEEFTSDTGSLNACTVRRSSLKGAAHE
jgi:hypothetical protein